MKITIYGTGWLGKPLAEKLVQNKFEVIAPNWRAKTYQSIDYWKPMIESPIQVWSIPPRVKQNGPDFYEKILTEWTSFLQQNQVLKIVFLSSTSVYESSGDLITEESATNPESIITKAEQIIINSGLPHLIIRLGGLMGGDRFVAKYYAGKTVERANDPVNYLHQEDAVSFVSEAIQQNLSGIYNLVAPEHPLRKAVVEASCRKHNLPFPVEFKSNENSSKIISAEKISEKLGLSFKHPNPINY